MAITKFKDMPPLWVLAMFGGSYDSYKYNERLTRLFMEIKFKLSAVSIAFNLILEQEEVIQREHSKLKKTGIKSYKSEVKQMAYLGFFLDAVYALTEKISQVTKIFHNDLLKNGFNRQKKKLLKDPKINPFLSELMHELIWYDLFREVRVQHSHYGTSILAFGYDKEPQMGSSQLIIDVAGGEEKKVLVDPRYNFDLRRTIEIKEGIERFIQQWSLILIKKLDMKTTFSPDLKGKIEVTLGDFMKGREWS